MIIRWEIFNDQSFFHMWAVRPVGDRDFNSPRLFHVKDKSTAEQLKKILNEAHTATKGDYYGS